MKRVFLFAVVARKSHTLHLHVEPNMCRLIVMPSGGICWANAGQCPFNFTLYADTFDATS